MAKSKLVEIKTKPTTLSVEDFLSKIIDSQKRSDSIILVDLIQKLTNEQPKMWGASMIGFGEARYKSPATGREVDWFKIGFSPRKANLSIHLVGSTNKHEESLQKLGKHKASVGCIYINKLGDIDLNVLEDIIKTSFDK